MPIVNLRLYYPNIYDQDCYVDIDESVVAEIYQWERAERNALRKMFRYRAQFSLDWNDGLEQQILLKIHSPEVQYEKQMSLNQLHKALSLLPPKQRKRIHEHFFLGMSQSDIARHEGVHKTSIRKSILDGIQNLEIFLRKFQK